MSTGVMRQEVYKGPSTDIISARHLVKLFPLVSNLPASRETCVLQHQNKMRPWSHAKREKGAERPNGQHANIMGNQRVAPKDY